MYEGLYENLFGWVLGVLINSNAGYAQLNWEKSPVYNCKKVRFPLGGWAVA